jgi:very-short-patch-repair endonuclease
MKLMGARLLTLGWLKSTATGFPFTFMWRRGKILRHAKLKREVRIGKCYVDFANDINWIIEIDGSPWHQDVVADFDREVYLREFLRRQKQDLRILRIPAPRLWHDSARVQRDVLKFLTA